MGIMMAWYARRTQPGYPRPRAPRRCAPRWCRPTTSARAPTACTARRTSRATARTRTVLQPAGPDLEPADGRHAGRERRRRANSVGSVKVRRGDRGNPATAADEADVSYKDIDMTDVRSKPASPTTPASCRLETTSADHRPRQRPVGGRHGPGHARSVTVPCTTTATPAWARPARSTPPPTRSGRARSRRAGARSGSSARSGSTTAAPTESCPRARTRCSPSQGVLRPVSAGACQR